MTRDPRWKRFLQGIPADRIFARVEASRALSRDVIEMLAIVWEAQVLTNIH